MKIYDKCAATMMFFSAHQELVCFHPGIAISSKINGSARKMVRRATEDKGCDTPGSDRKFLIAFRGEKIIGGHCVSVEELLAWPAAIDNSVERRELRMPLLRCHDVRSICDVAQLSMVSYVRLSSCMHLRNLRNVYFVPLEMMLCSFMILACLAKVPCSTSCPDSTRQTA